MDSPNVLYFFMLFQFSFQNFEWFFRYFKRGRAGDEDVIGIKIKLRQINYQRTGSKILAQIHNFPKLELEAFRINDPEFHPPLFVRSSVLSSIVFVTVLFNIFFLALYFSQSFFFKSLAIV